ncbi:MAG: hypothetical protein U0U66_13785 [Cytophagaceae bacterium]
MKKSFYYICTISLAMLWSCGSSPSEYQGNPSDTSDVIINDSTEMVQKDIELVPLDDSPEFNDAILEWNQPLDGQVLPSGEVAFQYNIKNYKLSAPTTEGTCAQHCANSDKGQHIHLILNNQPYLAKYETSFKEKLEDGHYVALSFLSRSYHESIKHYQAYQLCQFDVGKKTKEKVDLTQPMMFYSRPKGEYKGKDTESILLDFYVVNTQLSATGNKVRATINGKLFTLDTWKPFLIKNLPAGTATIKLELVDVAGNVIPGPYNTVERTITVVPTTGV